MSPASDISRSRAQQLRNRYPDLDKRYPQSFPRTDRRIYRMIKDPVAIDQFLEPWDAEGDQVRRLSPEELANHLDQRDS